jgi:hypothetical protein
MKKLWILVVLLFLIGCGPTANQLKLGQAYYQAMAARQSNPYVEIKIADPTKPTNIESIKVWGPEQGLAQYQERDYAQPWINLTSSVLSVAVPWIGAAAIVHSIGDIAGNNTTSYNQTVSGTNNTGRIAGPANINANVAGNSNTLGGAVEQSIPTTTTTNTTTTPTTTTTSNTGTTTTGDVTM